MARIVIIDDWINPKYISKSIKIDYIFIDPLLSLEKKNNSITTHASLVAKVLEHYGKEFEVINIVLTMKMIEDVTIHKVKKALHICEKIEPDIIVMSFGTERIGDGRILSKIIQRLYHKNVIMVAAAANNGMYMLPAGMHEVIGVGAVVNQSLPAGLFIASAENFWNIDFIVNDNLNITLKRRREIPSTSCAVPVIAAIVNSAINEGYYGQSEIRKYLEEKSTQQKLISSDNLFNIDNEITEDIPIIVLKGFSKLEWNQLIQDMNERFNVECLGVTSKKKELDYCIMYGRGDIIQSLKFIQNHTVADLILLDNDIDFKKVYPDIFVEKDKDYYIVTIAEKNIKTHFITLNSMNNYLIRSLK